MPKEPLLICDGFVLILNPDDLSESGFVVYFAVPTFLSFMKSPSSVVVLGHQCLVQKVFSCVN